MDTDILREQIMYYRARAQEYDASTQEPAELQEGFARARTLLQRRDSCQDVLELACGTGTWTQVLLIIGQKITALDASPEMLELARQKLGVAHVQYQQVDLFQWKPEREYDLIFFANWLSHVPPHACGAFLRKIARAVRTGGALIILDQFAPTKEDQEVIQAGAEGQVYAQRSLSNGQRFTIVKAFYTGKTIQEMLTPLGFEVKIEQLNESFFFLEARRLDFAGVSPE